MDVLIKNMKMPQGCSSCELCFLCSDEMNFCCTRLIGQRFDIELSEQRQEGCPLMGLPTHGRLKDESVIIQKMEDAFCKLFPIDGKHRQVLVSECHKAFLKAVFDSPTIVEASNGTDN